MQSLHPSEIGLVVEVQVVIVLEVELNLIYDANGNLVAGDGKFRVYNEFNQLAAVYNGSSDVGTLLEEFSYHPMEERILTKKTYNSSGTLIETLIYVNKNFVRVVNLSGTYDFTHAYHENQLVGQRNSDGSKLFIHADQEGSSMVVTNEAQTIVENTTYSPFGEVLTGGNEVRYGYEGKEHDTVVGDTDFNFRKYKAEWGLFTQPDTLIQNVYDPQSLNRYSFERNNPYNRVDPSGHTASYRFVEGTFESLIHSFLDLLSPKEKQDSSDKADEVSTKESSPREADESFVGSILIGGAAAISKVLAGIVGVLIDPKFTHSSNPLSSCNYGCSPNIKDPKNYLQINYDQFRPQEIADAIKAAEEGKFSFVKSKVEGRGEIGHPAYVDEQGQFHQATGGYYKQNPVNVYNQQKKEDKKSRKVI